MLLLPAPSKYPRVPDRLPDQGHERDHEESLGQPSQAPTSSSPYTAPAAKRSDTTGFTLQQIAYYLRLPEAECAGQLIVNKHFLAEVESRRTAHQPIRRLRRHLGKWRCASLPAYRELLASDPRSRILATFHFGDFAFGMNYLLRHEPVDRDCIVLTQRVSDDAYFDNMQRAFADRATRPEQQWVIDRPSSSRLGLRLRKESITLVTFCDLPPQFGAGTGTQFLGRRAQFPRGAASLACRHQIPILPVVCCYRSGLHHITLGQQLEPQSRHGESRSACIARLTQQLVKHLESFVRVYPSQWRFLGSLPAYFANSAGGEHP